VLAWVTIVERTGVLTDIERIGCCACKGTEREFYRKEYNQ
jgi:hypothetical protein